MAEIDALTSAQIEKLLAAAKARPELVALEWGEFEPEGSEREAPGAQAEPRSLKSLVESDPKTYDARRAKIRDRYVSVRFAGVARSAADLQDAARVSSSSSPSSRIPSRSRSGSRSWRCRSCCATRSASSIPRAPFAPPIRRAPSGPRWNAWAAPSRPRKRSSARARARGPTSTTGRGRTFPTGSRRRGTSPPKSSPPISGARCCAKRATMGSNKELVTQAFDSAAARERYQKSYKRLAAAHGNPARAAFPPALLTP